MNFYFLHVFVFLSKYIIGIVISNKDEKVMLLFDYVTNHEYLSMLLSALFIENCE